MQVGHFFLDFCVFFVSSIKEMETAAENQGKVFLWFSFGSDFDPGCGRCCFFGRFALYAMPDADIEKQLGEVVEFAH